MNRQCPSGLYSLITGGYVHVSQSSSGGPKQGSDGPGQDSGHCTKSDIVYFNVLLLHFEGKHIYIYDYNYYCRKPD